MNLFNNQPNQQYHIGNRYRLRQLRDIKWHQATIDGTNWLYNTIPTVATAARRPPPPDIDNKRIQIQTWFTEETNSTVVVWKNNKGTQTTSRY